MKDATGELSMTAVAVVAIAAISVLFSTLIWPSIRGSILRQTHCAAAYGCNQCDSSAGTCECRYTDSDDQEYDITCAMTTD